jgi:predicted transcriptional regulator
MFAISPTEVYTHSCAHTEAALMTTNVRIQRESHAKLRQLAREAGVSMPEILEQAIDDLYRKKFLEECNRAYARLRADPKAWAEELAERKLWDATLADGLEDM